MATNFQALQTTLTYNSVASKVTSPVTAQRLVATAVATEVDTTPVTVDDRVARPATLAVVTATCLVSFPS